VVRKTNKCPKVNVGQKSGRVQTLKKSIGWRFLRREREWGFEGIENVDDDCWSHEYKN
jgi:hypothetical protein